MQVASSSVAKPAAGPAPSPRAPAWLEPVRRYGEYVLGAGAAVGILVTLWLALVYAPTDVLQGAVQRIEYIHVPMAWVAYLAFFIVFVASVVYLWRGGQRWDLLGRASAEVGTVFTTLVLITGSLWGKPVWGTWWQWDARLTTTLILWFIYVGYLLLRAYTGRSDGGARAAAVLGIVGFVDVPINYLSVTWWRTLHPSLQVPLGQQPQAPASVVTTLMISMLSFTLLFTFVLLQVYRLQKAQGEALRLRARVEIDRME
jgi:heme exporter protein C